MFFLVTYNDIQFNLSYYNLVGMELPNRNLKYKSTININRSFPPIDR